MGEQGEPTDVIFSEVSASRESRSHENDDDYEALPIGILALYQFVTPTVSEQQVRQWREDIDAFLRSVRSRGSLLVAVEGINGTICFPREYADDVEAFLRGCFPTLKTRRSYSKTAVYHRLKVRIKKEIVTMGPIVAAAAAAKPREETDDPAAAFCDDDDDDTVERAAVLRPVRTGEYVKPGPEWDALLSDPDCLVIDTRNEYEVELGTFRGALNPRTSEFCEFPTWLNRQLSQESRPSKIAMFCTGGIRCEKATAYCLELLAAENGNDGGDEKIPVYHLEGGILAYLDAVPAERSSFQGECFVFDKRTAVTHGLRPSESYTLCVTRVDIRSAGMLTTFAKAYTVPTAIRTRSEGGNGTRNGKSKSNCGLRKESLTCMIQKRPSESKS